MAATGLDVIVVGGGAMGLSAAHQCAKAGKSVLLLEQFDLFNKLGSSGGQSRFFRIMYADALLALLAEASNTLWNDLEREAAEMLRVHTGVLFWGVDSRAMTPEGSLYWCADVMQRLGITYERFDAAELRRRYPAVRDVAPGEIGLSQADSYAILADRVLHALARLAMRHGAVLRQREPVLGITPASAGQPNVRVRTTLGEYEAPRLILAPGAWTNEVLAPLGLRLNLKIWQMNIAYYEVAPSQSVPLWFYFGAPKGPDEQLYYGIPPIERKGQMKVGSDWTTDIYDSPAQATRTPNQAILDMTSAFLAQHLPGVGPKPVTGSEETCFFVMTPDQNLVLDLLPEHPEIAIFTGESGQSFKFTPLIGLALSELALAGTTRFNLSAFSITRKGLIAG